MPYRDFEIPNIPLHLVTCRRPDVLWSIWKAIHDHPVIIARLIHRNTTYTQEGAYWKASEGYVVQTRLLAAYCANKATALRVKDLNTKKMYLDICKRILKDIGTTGAINAILNHKTWKVSSISYDERKDAYVDN